MSLSEEPRLLCYNRGCGQQFRESENTAMSCRFHPGTPYFHDAYKGWTCCRKSTDFQEFLNMKGCATSFHSNEKPPEVEKNVVRADMVVDEVIEVCQPAYVAMTRPSVDSLMVCGW
jgi:cysteine/histidine-rich domain-containing protein 1